VPVITTDEGTVHYEVFGRGRPMILLHGWLGSWGLWQDTMTWFGETRLAQTFRTYALDFWGFGESGSQRPASQGGGYQIRDYIRLVDTFMERLGITAAPLVGHSMGGTISLSVALAHPQRVTKVVLVGSPLVGSSLALPLKAAGSPSVARLLFSHLNLFRKGLHALSPRLCSDPRFPQMIDRDLTQTSLESFLNSMASLRQVNLSSQLAPIKIPVLGIYGDQDQIVQPRQAEVLRRGIPHARVETYAGAGHFIMLDSPQRFRQSLEQFLIGDNTTS
jgi:pimeloyl-ACP methyl ester carboxylesterase